jgi:NAD(P)-dependent dehydrogenase (short-subunit alcohol dehydrogenase family)
MTVVAIDICAPIRSVHYPLATAADLDETVQLVRAVGGTALPIVADVRDRDQMLAAVLRTMTEFGRIDVVVANAAVAPIAGPGGNDNYDLWRDVVDVNLTGVWNTVQPCMEPMIDGRRGGSIVVISSAAGLRPSVYGNAGATAYTATKHGLVGLMRALAVELAPHGIRVNTVHPTAVNTPMIVNDYLSRHFAEGNHATTPNKLPVSMIEPEDVTDAVAWLVSDAARYVTGTTLPVDAGLTV